MFFSIIKQLVFMLLLSAAAATADAQDVPSAATRPVTIPQAITRPVADNVITAGTETIVFLRHGEKPADDLGQLSPRGLNRAIALSSVLPKKFGKPDFLFAPDPATMMLKKGVAFNYVRPLATIEPTAILLGMPVQTPFGFTDIDKLDQELTKAKYASAMIFVAWEHTYEAKAATALMKQFGGNPADVPHWATSDFDSLYIVKITRTAGQPPRITFALEHEGLQNMSQKMPVPAGN